MRHGSSISMTAQRPRTRGAARCVHERDDVAQSRKPEARDGVLDVWLTTSGFSQVAKRSHGSEPRAIVGWCEGSCERKDQRARCGRGGVVHERFGVAGRHCHRSAGRQRSRGCRGDPIGVCVVHDRESTACMRGPKEHLFGVGSRLVVRRHASQSAIGTPHVRRRASLGELSSKCSMGGRWLRRPSRPRFEAWCDAPRDWPRSEEPPIRRFPATSCSAPAHES